MKWVKSGQYNRKVKILPLLGKDPFSLFISLSLSCCASGHALIHLGIQGRLDEKANQKIQGAI